MEYKIAVASTDGIKINGHFGSINSFLIYEVRADSSYEIIEDRMAEDIKNMGISNSCSNGMGNCCGGQANNKLETRVSVISDCRVLLCYKIGADAARQLERKAMAFFQVSINIDAALKRIIDYYAMIDNRKQ